jgi:hypothetical protein
MLSHDDSKFTDPEYHPWQGGFGDAGLPVCEECGESITDESKSLWNGKRMADYHPECARVVLARDEEK